MYVGMTRARFLFGARMQNAPSQFLAEIPQDLLEHERVAPVWTPSAARSGTYGRQPSSGPAFQRAIAPPPRTTGVAAVRPKTEAPLLATGDTVRHSKFGEGIVIGRDGPDRVVVRFPESGEKLLDLSYAPLEKVG
jgi:DNA helicase-2/ATP-dependent DNA helicase PcrA